MLRGERDVAGLRCSQVLELLSLLIDGELPVGLEEQVRQHVAGCQVCERFGGEFVAVVAALRGAREPDALTHDVVSRLQARLERDLR